MNARIAKRFASMRMERSVIRMDALHYVLEQANEFRDNNIPASHRR